ncbi:PREDICTED: UPF0364 protein C6orf211 homolog [Ceratosolen solmsi marchali]|uniref:Sugar phosphate phosphatase n=1 Tax=Ceratosolen solmsi marchali TaxID=326594 RepID=A0AAJ6YM10_9HYME|nr:PREDICTED: UPF0364 protein C6orf211 homolog [Ceratosolen solmsi marchali]
MSEIKHTSNSGDINGLEDIETPFGSLLSGKYKRSFAYKTIKDRLPVIVTKIIDTLSRNKEDIAKANGTDAIEETKKVVGVISKLKNELMTNKPLYPLNVDPTEVENDAIVWNKKLEKLSDLQGESVTWYNAVWLICECYLYRRIAQEFLLTNHLKVFDPFSIQKREGYFKAIGSISHLSEYIMKLINTDNKSLIELREHFINLIKLNLWGNRCDLSLSSGIVNVQEDNPLIVLNNLDKEILVDNSDDVWQLLSNNTLSKENGVIIDFVLDNAGFELFTDLNLAAFLIEKKIANNIRFYVKQYPWFISDTTTNDFYWLIKIMLQSDNENIKLFGEFCENCLKNGSWTIVEESFWTEPFDFSEMKTENLALYNKLSKATLVIFKGDLNYRKLLGDINWEYTTDFLQALRGFRPTNIVSLRTIKADLCVGLSIGKAELLKREDSNWMTTGRFGLIQASIEHC